MNPTRHLQNLVGAQVQPGEHILAAFDDVAEARVVDHDGVESLNIERALAGSSHRQEVGLGFLALEERPNDSDRLASVIERAIYPRKTILDQSGGLFDSGARR